MTESASSRTVLSRLTGLAIAASIAVVSAFVITGTAHADTTLPGGTYCAFDVIETVITDNTKLIDNSSGTRFTGHFVVTFTANGKSKTFNASGATQLSVSDANILTVTYTGPSFVGIGTKGQQNTGQPGLVFSPGRTVVTVDLNQNPAVVTSFSATAPVTNICALLAP
jgi:hypothetical protein